MWRRWIFLYIAVFIVALDQFSKEWIRTNIPVGASLDEVLRVRIIHLENTGSAFGFIPDQSFLLTILALIGVIIIVIFYRQFGTASLLGNIATGMLFGGALGNLVDRIRLGSVTDFIYVRVWGDFFWPAWNVADACISIGVILLIWFVVKGFKIKDEVKS